MSNGTVTRADLTEAVYREIGLSRTESADLVEAVIEEIIDARTSDAIALALRFNAPIFTYKTNSVSITKSKGDVFK